MKNALEMNYSKHLLVTLPDLWVVHSNKMCQLQNVSLQVIPPQAAQANKWRKSAKLSMAVDEVPLQRLLAGCAPRMEHASKF